MNTRKVAVATLRCRQSKQCFAIRFERNGTNQWAATWAFPIKESVAKREGYEQNRMNGTFVIGDKYPGCPYCSARDFFQCACGRLACWTGQTNKVVCPTCSKKVNLGGAITSLEGSTDR